jgi:PAS domain S-box-containing protein
MEEKARYERFSKLLIVEDDQSQRRTLASIMEAEGFDVIACSTATEALEHLNRLKIGVVILDLRLPDLSGTQLLERLAAATDGIRVIINTAYSSYESAKDALNLGAFAYVEKAGDPQELLRHVHRAFEASLRSYADELETVVAERTRELSQANKLLTEEIADRKKAEEAYRTLVDNSLQGLAIFQDGRVVFANQAMAEIGGYTMDEMLTARPEQVQACVHPEDRTLVWSRHQQRLKGEDVPNRYEVRGIHKNGSLCWLEIYASRIEYRGRPAIHTAYVDITERKRAEKALRESEHQKRAILDSTPDLAWLKDKDGIYIAANEPLCKAYGVKLEDLVGKTDFDISPEDLAKKYGADDEKVMKSGKRKRVVEPWGKKKGKRIWIETIKTPIYNDRGEILGTSGIARDITERREAEEKARRHQSELVHVSRLSTLGQMASELAHELNQPLCATLTHLEGCLKMVKSGSSNVDKVLEKLETAAKQIDQAGAIVSRVKGFAMKGKTKRSTVFINDVAREAVSFSEMEIRNNHITAELNLGQKIRPVLANSIQIEQVILNLIQNAIEAMKDNPKKHRKLIISTTMLDDAVEVAVKDTGKGIDKDSEKNIFESFVTTKSEGLGIGLSICQSIVESHGGRIYFKDNSDRGVTFCFTLPPKAEKV